MKVSNRSATFSAVLALLAACSPGPQGTEDQSSAANSEASPSAQATAALPIEEPFQFQEPNPLIVEPHLDTERAVSEVITVEGGSLRAEAADGSMFTLTIPADVLLSDQAITITPLLGVEGQALSGGFAAGVNLAPDDLQLYDAATLTIEPAQAIPIERQLSFAVSDAEAFLYPLWPDAGRATFVITHFSDYYLGAGDEADLQIQMEHPPTAAGNQFLQQMQELIAGERGSSLLAEEGQADFAEQAEAMARSYLQQYLLARIAEAEGSQDWRLVCEVIAEVIGFDRTLHFLGITDLADEFDAGAALETLLAIQAELLLDYAEGLCRGDRALLGWIYALRVVRTQAVMNANYGIDLQGWQARCRQVELTFSSRMTAIRYQSYPDGPSRLISDTIVEAEVPLRYDSGQAAFVGEAPMELSVLDANAVAGYSSDRGNRYCDISWAPTASTLEVEKLTINLNHTDCDSQSAAENRADDPGIELLMTLGEPLENWTQDCSGVRASSGGFNISDDRYMEFFTPWVVFFRLRHRDKLTEDSQPIVEGGSWFFPEPSLLTFTEWRLSPDRSSADAEIEQFDNFAECEVCYGVQRVDDTKIEIR